MAPLAIYLSLFLLLSDTSSRNGNWSGLGSVFLIARTQLAGPLLWPEPGPFSKWVLFSTPNPPRPLMPSLAQNQNHKFRFMIFRPNITNTNINTEITNISFRFMIFPFKITNQTQISDFPFQNYKHKLTWLKQIEPRKKKKKKKSRTRWSEAMRPWKGSWVRSWGGQLSEAVRGWLTSKLRDGWGIWQMGKKDERGRGLCDSARMKQSWEGRELCLCLTACGLVAVWVRELRDEKWVLNIFILRVRVFNFFLILYM